MAKFLFVGLDANYDHEIETKSTFKEIIEYHENGVMFWEKHDVHHPFLLSGYNGSGKLYHENFAQIGFTSEHANLVSFIELLHTPTTGRSRLSVEDLNINHLLTVNKWIVDGDSKYVFLSAGVIKLMKQSKCFPWLPLKTKPFDDALTVLVEFSNKTIYKHLHFSNYGKFKEQMHIESKKIFELIEESNIEAKGSD
ncbi:MAG: hypothetical protein J7L25_08595 [Deltaproteobacteria bacterium]|nr:hypothetical protein [Candidatus Tharpella aukensis]